MRMRITALILTFAVVLCPSSAVAAEHWAADTIADAAARGYILADDFAPDATATRADFALMLWRALGSPESSWGCPFTDVPEDAPYRDAVTILYERAITGGTGSGSFNPTGAFTREMGLVMLARAWMLIASNDSACDVFADSETISPWARVAVSVMYENGYVTGVGENLSAPLKELSCAEVVTLLVRVVDGEALKRNVLTVQAPLPIYTEADLRKMGTGVDGWDLSRRYVLMADITLAMPQTADGSNWTPVGSGETPFTGIFDGNGHTIANLTALAPGGTGVGLFSSAKGAIIRSLSLLNVTIVGEFFVGGIVGTMTGRIGSTKLGAMDGIATLENCHVTGTVSGKYSVGGLAGSIFSGRIQGCANASDITATGMHAGGVAGAIYSGAVQGCTNTGTITSADNYVGGVVGNSYLGTINGSSNAGSISGHSDIGGVTGSCNYGTVQDSSNTGAITATGNRVGGVVGYNDVTTVRNCTNAGAITAEEGYVGGVAGYGSGTIQNCSNTGAITASSMHVGGVMGSASNTTIQDCFNTGAIESTGNSVGGVVGYCTSIAVKNCYNGGSVTGEWYVGGIVGYSARSTTTIENCAALNADLSATVDSVPGRILGIGYGQLTNNYAGADMILTYNDGASTKTTIISADGADGTDVTAAAYHTRAFWEDTLGWDFEKNWMWPVSPNPLPISAL